MIEKRALKFLRKACSDASGQSALESLLCSIIIFILLIGLLQIFHLAVATLLTDYSAFRTARSYCVGFADYLQDRSSRVGAIGASGKITDPDNDSFGSPMSQFASEELMIPDYIAGVRWLEYEYWGGENDYTQYGYMYFDADVSTPNTTLSNSNSELLSGSVQTDVTFHNYPFPFLDLFDRNRIIFDTVGQSIDVGGTSNLANHAYDYLVSGE
ncbi:MAG TPA: hypothetical protein DCZ94_21780 [Lentisphaeria bacterium]|nr:MAG: hypothetical protein A2X48_19375 [Lentisphaerae bacterium GWF2_49_21]HBC89577.1 hypothetical protein [Lentisphaeria bacterium]